MEKRPTPEDLAEWHRRWEIIGPSRVAEALLSGALNLLVDIPSSEGGYLDSRPHAQKWLNGYIHRAKKQEEHETRVAWLTLILAMISAIAAIIASIPVVMEWLD